jgi:hypothetical protein
MKHSCGVSRIEWFEGRKERGQQSVLGLRAFLQKEKSLKLLWPAPLLEADLDYIIVHIRLIGIDSRDR